MDQGALNVGYGTMFDQDQGFAFVFGGEACWDEVVNMVEEADALIQQNYDVMDSAGVNYEEEGIPTKEQYEQMRDTVTTYTDGNMIMTSWKWNAPTVTPGESAGLCITNPDDNETYWSCWSFEMDEEGMYGEHPKSVLVDPSTWGRNSRLSDYEDVTWGQFPAMYGGWMCYPPILLMNEVYIDCMRFLPGDDYSSNMDMKFEAGPVKVMTYLTSRASDNQTAVGGNSSLMTEAGENPTLQEFQFNLNEFLMGANGLAAVGVAIASIAALAF